MISEASQSGLGRVLDLDLAAMTVAQWSDAIRLSASQFPPQKTTAATFLDVVPYWVALAGLRVLGFALPEPTNWLTSWAHSDDQRGLTPERRWVVGGPPRTAGLLGRGAG